MPHLPDRWETHWDAGHNWALVLAAGEGSRLQALTMTASGVAVPKQFCSLGTSASLLDEALRRAQAVTPRERTCVVLAEQHRRWWHSLPLNIPPENMILQPGNRGTANGILLPLLRIVYRDPQATLLVLPSDHYVRNESVLASSLRRAVMELEVERDHLILLGMTPEAPDPELGYILPDGADEATIRAVRQFVEKPSAAAAHALIARGGVWNSFIFAARAQTLLRAFEAQCPDLVGEMRHVVNSPGDAATSRVRLAELYARLQDLDFSRDILQRAPSLLRLLTVPPCGWSDLGTPRRVGEAISRYRPKSSRVESFGPPALVDLAARHLQVNIAG